MDNVIRWAHRNNGMAYERDPQVLLDELIRAIVADSEGYGQDLAGVREEWFYGQDPYEDTYDVDVDDSEEDLDEEFEEDVRIVVEKVVSLIKRWTTRL